MEEVAWIFNGDFEIRLFSEQFQNIQSTKMTQEFEYFIYLLEPNKYIFTTKGYSQEYKDYIKSIVGPEIKTTRHAKNIIGWCSNYEQKEILLKYQNKETVLKIQIEKELTSEKICFLRDVAELEEGYLYKYSKSLSGGGHLKFPRDDIKIKKLLKEGETLIKEKIHKRIFDFSTLIEKGEVLAVYENLIDDYFQYKGTIISDDFRLPTNIKTQYEECLKVFLKELTDYKGVLSIDSFLYSKGREVKLFPACEFNMRKTMGYIAFSIKKKYFNHFKSMKLVLKKNKGYKLDYSSIARFSGSIFLLSPLENRFLVFVILGNSVDEINLLEEKLISAFF